MVIGIDFDGTCVKHKYPAVGEDIGAVPDNVFSEVESEVYVDTNSEFGITFYRNGKPVSDKLFNTFVEKEIKLHKYYIESFCKLLNRKIIKWSD